MIAFLCGTQQANAFQILVVANPDQVNVRMGKNAASDLALQSNGFTWANTAADNFIIVSPKENFSIEKMEIFDDDPSYGSANLITTVTPEEGTIEYDASEHASLGYYAIKITAQDGSGGGDIEVKEKVKVRFFCDTYPKSIDEVISSFTMGDVETDPSNHTSSYSTVEIDPETQKVFTLVTKDGYYFRTATLNGENIPFTSSGDSNIYTFEVAEGDAVWFEIPMQDTKVSANFTFNYGEVSPSDVVSSFSNGNEISADLYSEGEHQIEFKAGSENKFTLVTKGGYIFSTATINGSSIAFQPTEGVEGSYSYSFTVSENAQVVFSDPVVLTQGKANFTFNYAAKAKDSVLLHFYKDFDSYNNAGTELKTLATEGTTEIEFTYPTEQKFAVITTNGEKFITATQNGEALAPKKLYDWSSSYYIYAFDVKDGDEFVFSMEEPPVETKASFTFNYGGTGRGSKITRFFKNFNEETLTGDQLDTALADEGTREIEFMSNEGKFAIVPASSVPYVSIKVNGEPVEKSESKFMDLLPLYIFNVKENDVVTFSTVEEEEPSTEAIVTFSFENDEVKEAVTRIYYNGAYYSDLTSGVTVTKGEQFQIQFTSGYKLKFTANDEEISFTGTSVYYSINEDTEIHVSGKKLGKVDFTVNVDNASHVVFKAYATTYSSSVVELEDGENTVNSMEVAYTDYSANKVIYGIKFEVAAPSECTIESVTDEDGNPVYKTSSYYLLEKGTTVNITTTGPEPAPVEDLDVYVYVSNIGSVVFNDKDKYSMTEFDLDEGYNDITVTSDQNPFYISNSFVLINGEEPAKTGNAYFDVVLKNDDFVMVFGGGMPTLHTVSIDLPADVEAVVKKHHKEEVTDLTAIEMYEGTELLIEPSGDKPIYVYAPAPSPAPARSIRAAEDNDEDNSIVDNGDGTYTVKVNEKTANLRVSHNDPTGINEIVTEFDENAEVYNLQGLRIDSAKNLPAGIYIMNGKKVLLNK